MHSTKLSRILRFAQDAVARRNTEAHEEGTESGFTLIELMVVLLIMAILLAIAIPTFLGVKGGAQDRAAQSNLTNALTSSKAVYASVGSYPTAAGSFAATMSTQEPELTFATTAAETAAGNGISFEISTDGQQIILANFSPNHNGTCWALSDNNGASTALGAAPTGDDYGDWYVTTAAPCNASTAAAGTAAFWQTSYPTAAETAP